MLLPLFHPFRLLQKEWKAGREVASALLDLFLTAEETSQASWSGQERAGWPVIAFPGLCMRATICFAARRGVPQPRPAFPSPLCLFMQAGEHAGFKHLLSLHAFAVTDVELCQPPSDPAKFVRSLAPYLKASGKLVGCQGLKARSVRMSQACHPVTRSPLAG